MQNALNGERLTPGYVIKQLCQLSIGGPAVGIAFGLVMVVWLRFIYNQDVVEVTMTIVAALGCFIVGNMIPTIQHIDNLWCMITTDVMDFPEELWMFNNFSFTARAISVCVTLVRSQRTFCEP